MVVDRKIKKIVIDTSAFLKNVPLWDFAEEFYCVSDVIREIKDKTTRRYIDSLPIQLQLREPSPSSLKHIFEFTKKTGDYASLSLPDIKVLALTYELETEMKGNASHLRSEPLKQRIEQIAAPKLVLAPTEIAEQIEGFYVPSKKKGTSTRCASHLSSSLSLSSDEEITFTFCEEHLQQINNHLTLYPYLSGYFVMEQDLWLLKHLLHNFPLLKKTSDLVSQHRVGRQWKLIQEICQSHIHEPIMVKSKCLTESDKEGESLKIARQFSRDFTTQWPHFVRWFFHLLNMDKKAEDFSANWAEAETQISSSKMLAKLFEQMSRHHGFELIDENEESDSLIADLNCLEVNGQDGVTVNDQLSPSSQETPCNFQSEIDRVDDEDISDNGSDDTEFDNKGYEDADASQEDEEELLSWNSDTDDEDGWITPSNIKSLKQNTVNQTPVAEKVDVVCITGDYSVQNVLKHIGLQVMGIDGKVIESVRTFILRCYACFKTTSKMEKIFCPHCGNKTLKKVSVTLNPDGSQRIWISTKKSINVRGMKYRIPPPQGGKHARNPIVVADQREAQERASKLARMKNNPMSDEYDTRSFVSPFLTRDVYSRAAQLGIRSGKKSHQGTYYWEQRNPSMPLQKNGRRKKKR